jgi:hypothetical protein
MNVLLVLPFGDTASVGITRCAGRNWKSAGLGNGDLGLSGRGSDLGGCSGTGDGEDEDESADDDLHLRNPFILLYF